MSRRTFGLAETTSALARRNAITTAPLSDDAPGTLHLVPETDEIVALSLVGEFDLANAPRIVEESERVLADEKHLILDLSRATFIDSSVINALFGAHKRAKERGRLAVLQLGTAAIVELVLKVSEIERVLPRVHTRAEAIGTIRSLMKRS
jgi:anti-anti-sigma factor